MNPRNIIRRCETVEVHPSADELAGVFWAMDAEEQAWFFNTLGELSGGKLPLQLVHVMDGPHINDTGRRAMRIIGEYGEVLK